MYGMVGIEGYIDGVIDDVPNKAKTKKEKINFVTFFKKEEKTRCIAHRQKGSFFLERKRRGMDEKEEEEK